MKNKITLPLCALAVLVTALLWLPRSREKPKLALAVETPNTNASIVENTLQPTVNTSLIDTSVSMSSPTGQTVLPANYIAAEEKARAMIEAQNIPIDFYGHVIDQDSNSLFGVKIHAHVRHWQAIMDASSIPVDRETDAGGRFEIHGLTGDVLGVETIQKEGYEIEPYAQLGFGAVGGSFEAPVVFKMWKNDVRQPLITGETFFKVASDGRKYTIDLIKGTSNESSNSEGDLSVWIKRSEPLVGRKYDWSFDVQANNGGLAEELDKNNSMYLAPGDSYTNVFNGGFLATDPHWGNAIAGKRFYIKTRNGQVYGRVEIEVYPSYGSTGEGRFWIKYAVNPTGSRILH